MKSRFWLAALALGTPLAAAAQTPPVGHPATAARAEVLVVGTYHMANPGRDIFNMEADDVLAAKRQAEIAEAVALLARFRPTKIAVEAEVGDERVAKRYGDYLAGDYELGRNEIEQLGFRLAKQLGHPAVHPVDVEGEFPFQRIVNFAQAKGRGREIEALMAEVGAMVEQQGAYLASHSVLETLLFLNTDEKSADGVGFYYRQAQLGEAGDWAGADFLTEWIRRNLRIYTHIAQLVESPQERVLVLYGAGHLGWLQRDVASSPNLRLRKLAELAE